MRSLIVLLAGCSFWSVSLATTVIGADVDYEEQVKPLLRRRCVTCHGPLRHQAGLRLDTAALARKGGDSGPAIKAGAVRASLIIQRVTTDDDDLRMPPEGEPLNEKEIAILTRWIEQGAKAPEGEEPLRDPALHWAFRKPVRPDVPTRELPANASDSTKGNPIDAFLARKYRDVGLVPQSRAARRVLLRRVYLDLIGLPPTPGQMDAFLKDESADSWSRMVDELLDSPHYGERWGRHWMDVWRYSDWYGYRAELRNSARHIWRWRDWIVESLNEDRPYNRMIIEMLAGDELAPADPETVRATGFLARHYYKFNRNTWLEATIEHTSKAFLGITMNCARCHDHMYDPISQKEYYQFRAVFEPYLVRTDRVAGQADITKDGLSLAYDAKPGEATFLFFRGNDKYPDKKNPLTAALPQLFGEEALQVEPVSLPALAYYPGLRPHIQDEAIAAARAKLQSAQTVLAAATTQVEEAKTRLTKLTADRDEKEKSPKKPIEPKPTVSTVRPIVADDFTEPRPDRWEEGSGEWEYADGHLIQKQTGIARRTLTLKHVPPRDFSATFQFRILGGDMWKSVGLSFDVHDAKPWQTVYVSAYSGGPKVQYSHGREGKWVYPQQAMKALPIKVGQVHTLRVDVRDRLLNVWVDGQRVFAWQIAQQRNGGRFSLWTFDAKAEFHSFKLSALPVDTRLASAGTTSTTPAATSVEQATAQVRVAVANLKAAQQSVVAAQAALKSVEARITADKTRYGKFVPTSVSELVKAAAQAERQSAVESATAALFKAEAELTAIQASADGTEVERKKKLDAATKKKNNESATLEATRKKLDEPAGSYTAFSTVYPTTSTGRRLALAKWIADRDNPLTARVAVNHIWMRHFDSPLVPTVFDFGMNGKSPTHPELLDWLAVEFIENDWSMKHLHRLIVTSNAWQMRSTSQGAPAKNLEADPDNRFLWRMNPRRLESELVRDCVLAVAGTLDRTAGGPELDSAKGLSTFRRSIYYRHAPEKFMTFLELFDSASANECYRRNETIVPQQALALANSPLAIEQSRLLTKRLIKELSVNGDMSDSRFVETLFQNVLCRLPSSDERETCLTFLQSQTEKLQQTKNLTTFSDGPKLNVLPSNDPHTRARENLAHVLLNHNDFVTVR